jgi:uncharacterized protein YggE
MLTRLIATLALATLLFIPVNTTAFAEEAKLNRTISVSGTGEVRAIPDMATITLGVMSTAATAQEALAANSKSMNDVLALLKQQGIEDRDISTSNFNVSPRYEYRQDGTQPKVTGYDVSNNVTLTVRKIEALGDLLDKAVSAGSNQVYGIAFSVSKPDALLDAARKNAVADARRKAEIYAAAGGFTLGDIVSLSEGGGYHQPMPVVMKSAAADMASTPVAQGEQALSIDVSVVWSIK